MGRQLNVAACQLRFGIKRARRRSTTVSALLFSFALPVAAVADEGGVPFWFSGQYASLAAVPTNPGWSLPVQGYYYSGGASGGQTFDRAGEVTAGLQSHSPLILVQPTYAPKEKIAGGQAAFGLGFGYGSDWTEADLERALETDRSDNTSGFTDLYPIASIAWSKGVNNWMTYLTGDVPVGDYEPFRLSNVGLGHAAIDAGGGYTYLDQTTGREFSAVAGLTYNFENPDTNYQSGIDSHIDWAASQFLSENWQIGVAGYGYFQLTGDSGAGDRVGSFKSSVAAIGPEVGYAFKFNDAPAYFNLRGYWEFWAEDRLQGSAVFATLALPLGAASRN
jgi:hypothetical protein